MAISLELLELLAPRCMRVTPYTDTQVASVVSLVFYALSWCVP